jgi:hypothetical protein
VPIVDGRYKIARSGRGRRSTGMALLRESNPRPRLNLSNLIDPFRLSYRQ